MPDEVKTARVLAVDAGFAACGWAVVDVATGVCSTCGVISSKPTAKKRGVRVADDDARRCAELAERLREVIGTYEPAAWVVELPTGGAKGARANRCMGMATGMIAAVVLASGLPAEWTTPRDGKVALAGKAGATKDEMMAAAQSRWPGALDMVKPALREHVADALAAWLAARDGQMVRTLRQMTGCNRE